MSRLRFAARWGHLCIHFVRVLQAAAICGLIAARDVTG